MSSFMRLRILAEGTFHCFQIYTRNLRLSHSSHLCIVFFMSAIQKYSLIETAKENHLDPYRYLLWVLWNAPALSQADVAWAEQLTLTPVLRMNAEYH